MVGSASAQVTFDSLGSDRSQLLFTGSVSGEFTLHISPEALPVAGTWENSGDRRTFTPLFPLNEEQTYYLKSGDRIVYTISLPKTVQTAPSVVIIHPQSDTVPANLLKFYVVFDQPMATGHADEHILLYNPSGHEEEDAFLHMEQELWSYTGDTLTMWFDPGRIKRDLVPNETMGNPLDSGGIYNLHISSGWPAAKGGRTTIDYMQILRVAGMDRTRPDPGKWKIHSPDKGTAAPMLIEFDEPMDMGALSNNLRITMDGKDIQFAMKWGKNDRSVSLEPYYPWQQGNYTLIIGAGAEDLAGNNLNRLFDQEVNESGPAKETFVLEFTIR